MTTPPKQHHTSSEQTPGSTQETPGEHLHPSTALQEDEPVASPAPSAVLQMPSTPCQTSNKNQGMAVSSMTFTISSTQSNISVSNRTSMSISSQAPASDEVEEFDVEKFDHEVAEKLYREALIQPDKLANLIKYIGAFTSKLPENIETKTDNEVRRLLIHVYSLIDTLDSYFESAKIEGGEEENAQSKQLQNQLEDQLNQLDFYKEKILDRIKQIVDEKQPDSNKDCSMPSHMQEHLPERKSIDDSLANQWLEIQSLYQGRLWHELTIRVKSFVRQDELQHDDRLKNFYENFLSNFEQHINQLELVEIIIPISRTFKQVEEAVQFIQQIREKVKNHSLAVLLCDITIGKAYLVTKNLIETKKIIEDLTPKFDELDHLTTVHSRFYDLASNYYRVMGNHCDYYQSTLKYFGCVDNASISLEEKVERAFYLGLAALLAENVYDFGEILQHPVLDALKNTREQWLIDLLQAFNIGDVDQYESLKSIWQAQPDLRMAEKTLKRKITLLCLMDMISVAGGTRALSFHDVAARTKLPLNQIELLAMHALSLGLIRGSIDEVNEKLNIHWVKPRVLDLGQVSTLQKQLDQWINDVKQMSTLVEQQTGDNIAL